MNRHSADRTAYWNFPKELNSKFSDEFSTSNSLNSGTFPWLDEELDNYAARRTLTASWWYQWITQHRHLKRRKPDHILWACQSWMYVQCNLYVFYILYFTRNDLWFENSFCIRFVSLCLPSPGVKEWCGHWHLSGHEGGLQLATASLYQGSGVENENFCGWNDVPMYLPLVSFKCQVLFEIWNQRTWEMPCQIPSLMWKLHFHCHRFQKRWDNLVLCRDVGEKQNQGQQSLDTCRPTKLLSL